MSSASLAVASPTHLDSTRIAAISVALALNLAFMLGASRPITVDLLSAMLIPPVQTIRFIDPPAVVPPPPPIEMLPLPSAPPVAHATVQPHPLNPPVTVPTTDGQIATPPISTPNLLPTTAIAVAPTPVAATVSLAYLAAPLHFPARAIKQHMHGIVVLRVLVDEHGKPLKVLVEQGSGYALLDRSATEQVLASWRFQPAMANGHAVRAWAKVPVSFNLR